jgi:hypothetical protein
MDETKPSRDLVCYEGVAGARVHAHVLGKEDVGVDQQVGGV